MRSPRLSPALLTSLLALACGGDGFGFDPSAPRAIVLSPERPKVVAGQTLQLEAKAVDWNGVEIPGADIRFESSLPIFITVNETGLLTSLGEYGPSMITATLGDVSAKVQAEVVAPPSVLLVRPESLELAAGESRQVTAWYIDENSEAVYTAEFSFQTSDTAVVRVEPDGFTAFVTAGAAGTATVTVTSGDRSVQIPVTVTQ